MSLRYYITDRKALGGTAGLLESIRRALRDSVDWIQVREKDLGGRELAELTSRVLALENPYGTRILLNERADIAVARGAHGVHLRSGAVAPGKIREIVPPGFLIGVSCHAVAEVARAGREGADFAVMGPVFASPGKGPPVGLRALEEAAAASSIPVLALGGITPEREVECLRSGAAGIAGIRLFQALGR